MTARWVAGFALAGVLVGAGVWLFGRGEEEVSEFEGVEETETHQQVRGAVLHNVSRELVEEVLRIEAHERRVAETVWAKEMLAQECGRTFERLWDEINAVTNRLRLGADSAVEGGGQLHSEHWGGKTEDVEDVEDVEARQRGKARGELAGGTRGGDQVFQSAGKLSVVAGFGVGQVVFGKWDPVEELPHGIGIFTQRTQVGRGEGAEGAEAADGGAGTEVRGNILRNEEWRSWVEGKVREGWQLEQVEFRHNRFEVVEENKPGRSVFYFVANLVRTAVGENGSEGNGKGEERVSLEGDLGVEWGAKGEDGYWTVRGVDASGLVMKLRVGKPVFQLAMDEMVVPREQERWIDPLMVYDLDGDGMSEIILAARNLVYRRGKSYTESTEGEAQRARREEGNSSLRRAGWVSRELCSYPEGFVGTALLADVTGDGVVDLVVAKWEGVFVFEGAAGGVFPEKARLVWKAEKQIERAMVLTCGDVDGDEDLDLYLGQYKDPYEGGATPHPFYDANDGYPCYLLANQGGGAFADGTVAAGLERKRNRRTFSASLVDLDLDRDRGVDLDLMVVSDFAGLDFYVNDGMGKFSDVTTGWVEKAEERVGFGMAHCIADFNNDGLLDVLMIGMTSPTMDRLKYMGLARAMDGRERELEVAMTYGNRLLLGKRGGGFEQGAMSESIARAGWAWGCASLDFDNDGWKDVYIANGFQSRGTVTDSEGDYWLHDRFLESELGAQATDLYFKSSGARNRGSVRSFGGHERNRLYWNRGGTNFLEVGYLLGVSVGADSRNVVADDLDGDGRVDLVMTTEEVWPNERQTLKIFRNGLQSLDGGGMTGEVGRAPGVPENEIKIGEPQEREVRGRKQVEVYVTGDGFRSQGSKKGK